MVNGRKQFTFDLFICDLDGNNLEKVTYFDGGPGRNFDGFPMFSRDGRYLAFSSNRGDGKLGETNVFIAEWVDDPFAEEAVPAQD